VIELVEEANLMVIDGPKQQLAYDWMSLIIAYLDNHPLSDDNAEIEHVTRKARMYHLIDGVLYRQGVNDMMMMCISKEEGIQLLQDIHSGVCEAHSSWRSVIKKHSCMDSTSRQSRMTRWKSSPSVKTASSSRSKPRSM
jgi:hypothetical protein